jgi:membrane protein YqaA with SNARE-associated domain
LVLYLGPFIAQTTMAASECNSIDFDTSGPRKFICPDDPAILAQAPPNFWEVLSKVQAAAFLWGLGTAIGELPPYFVALASHRSGKRVEEFDGPAAKESGFVNSMKQWVEVFLQKFGFFAIVIFASVPNPLFDLAGLTCGHFGVPFWTFFGATFIGKAVVKAHLQTFVVIALFNKKHLEDLITFVSRFFYFRIYPDIMLSRLSGLFLNLEANCVHSSKLNDILITRVKEDQLNGHLLLVFGISFSFV